MKIPHWSLESLTRLTRTELETLLQNAKRLNNQEIAALCEAELASRLRSRKTSVPSHANNHVDEFVIGYHFVCKGHHGVTENKDGIFLTGSWVVAEHNVEQSLSRGAYVALHETKELPSYLQGNLIGYRHLERKLVDKENFGIEFHCRYTPDQKVWVGDGSGEKGYNWQPTGSNRPI